MNSFNSGVSGEGWGDGAVELVSIFITLNLGFLQMNWEHDLGKTWAKNSGILGKK